MSISPLTSKVAAPYARALFDFSVEENIMHQITADFQSLNVFLEETESIVLYLQNPTVNKEAKRQVLRKALESQINTETFKFLMVLLDRNRINLLRVIVLKYLDLVYEVASVKMIDISTAFEFSDPQKEALIQKLKTLTNAREIRLTINVDSNLIGGFLVKTPSKVLDFTVKNQLVQLAKHLETVLEI